MSHKKCHCGEELNDEGCCESEYPPSMTIVCTKCDECFNPDVSGLDGVCDTCHFELEDKQKIQNEKLCTIGDDWDKVHTNTKIHLPKDTEYPTFHGKTILLKSGNYSVVGFWANIVKLADTHKEAMEGDGKYHIKSINLREFQRRKN